MTAEPRLHTARNLSRPTDGPGVAIIGEAKGRTHMPWQRRALDVALERDPVTGHYAYPIVVVTVPRQSGKTTIEGDTADHRCLTTNRARVWVTMQNGKTVDSWMREEHFTDLAAATVFGHQGSPSCRYSLSKRAGEVGVRWPSLGSTFLTFPPKEDALHSKQGDLVIVDEAWVHDREAGHALRQAIRPTMATRKGAQLWIVSTEGTDASEYLDHYLSMARAAVDDPAARVCLIDYGLRDEDDPEDLNVIAGRHPAYGHTLTMDALVDARVDFAADAAGWARAYGNRPTRTLSSAFPPGVWSAAGRSARPLPDRAGLAFDVTPAGDRAAVAASWGEADHRYVELLHTGHSDRAFVSLLIQLARARRVPLMADRGSYAALEVADAVTRNAPDVEVTLTGLPEYAAACATFDRGIRAAALSPDQRVPGALVVMHHLDPDLTTAAENATKVDKGDGGWAWGRKVSSGSIAELVAATLAVRAFDALPLPTMAPAIITATDNAPRR